ncbi:MAG: nuclease A inhibitor family protein [Pyrinomonadaceae bacterium]
MLKTEHNYIDADFRSRLESICHGLVLVSETDSDVVPIFGSIPNSDEAEELLESVGMKVGTPITTVGFEDFFERLSKQHDWFTNEQVENARGFRALKLVFDNELKKIKVFKIGKNNLQIVVIGQDRNGFAVGVTMHAIET